MPGHAGTIAVATRRVKARTAWVLVCLVTAIGATYLISVEAGDSQAHRRRLRNAVASEAASVLSGAFPSEDSAVIRLLEGMISVQRAAVTVTADDGAVPAGSFGFVACCGEGVNRRFVVVNWIDRTGDVIVANGSSTRYGLADQVVQEQIVSAHGRRIWLVKP